MTIAQLEKRLRFLEKKIAHMQSNGVKPSHRWWLDDAGRFANDPVFEEMIQLGREYRESLRPATKKTRRARS